MLDITPPRPDFTLPPLLHCLATYFLSTQPLAVLSPLLTPILRQRVQLLSQSSSDPHAWLPLLCWDAQLASQLPATLKAHENLYEAHPLSGQIEIGTLQLITYKQLDEETLHARIVASDFDLVVVLLWCREDEAGLSSKGEWLVTEVQPLTRSSTYESWAESIEAAYNIFKTAQQLRDTRSKEAQIQGNSVKPLPIPDHSVEFDRDNDENDDVDADDDYWNSYDRTPGQTPAPPVAARSKLTPPDAAGEEAAYYAQYSQVQPEMDPSANDGAIEQDASEQIYQHPTPSSPSSSKTQSKVTQLEDIAESIDLARQNGDPDQIDGNEVLGREKADCTEIALRQHISVSVKSMFRLCRASGMSRQDFEFLVNRELQCCKMEEMYDDLD